MADYISREAAYKTLTEYYHHSSGVQHTVLREALNRVPTADVRPVRKAKWENSEQQGLWFSRCSGDDGCGGYVPGCTSYRFCPNCGAAMRKVVEIDQVKEGAE